MDKPVIPSKFWQRIQTFLRSEATGQIVLRVHRGKVSAVSLNEEIRQDADDKRKIVSSSRASD